jgi:hypothetical protein
MAVMGNAFELFCVVRDNIYLLFYLEKVMKMKAKKIVVLLVLCIATVQAGAELLSIAPPTDGVGVNPWYQNWRWYDTPNTGYNYGDERIYVKFDLSPLTALAAQYGQALQINSVTFGAFGGSLTNRSHSFTDALYAVDNTAWTETTIPTNWYDAGVLPLGSNLGSWSFLEWDWNLMSSEALKDRVVAIAGSANKQAAFSIAASVLDDYANDMHTYYFNSTNMKLDIDYTIPEPTTIALMGFGLVGLLRRKYAKA